MSRRESEKAKEDFVAYVEDADQDGNPIEGAAKVAASVAASSPTKEKPNTSKSRGSRKSGNSSPRDSSDRSSRSSASSDSSVTAHPNAHLKQESSSSRHKSSSSSKDLVKTSGKKVVTYARPSPKHTRTTPTVHSLSSRRSGHSEDSVYYGVDPEPMIQPASSRPRARTSATTAHRHSSYYTPTSSKPPLANARYYNGAQPSIVAAIPPTSFPPPAWMASGPPQPLQPSPQDYFARPLSHRFGPGVDRPMSAMAHRPTHFAEEHEPESRTVARRPSTRKKQQSEEDRFRMPPPPPPRSSSARPLAIRPAPFAPPPVPAPVPSRRSVNFDDHQNPFDADPSSHYRDVSPLVYDHAPPQTTRARRPSVGAHSISYDQGLYRTEVARSGSSRRNSYYGAGAVIGGGASLSHSNHVEDKLRAAAEYQADTSGGVPMALTAETLRKVSKNGGSSLSTRSSASRDESDYRQSATTRTTRSSNEDDVTIRVKGGATLKFGGAEVQCQDGAEINVTSSSSRPIPPITHRGSSDRSSYADPLEERRASRHERAGASRHRASSQAGSYSRTMPIPMYERGFPPPHMYDYGYSTGPPPPPPPPPGAYSASFGHPFGYI